MTPDIRAAVARIHVGESRGTGALVRDKAGRGDLVLTALHVVANTRGADPIPYGDVIRVEFLDHTTTAALERFNVVHDWALLRCDPPSSAQPLSLFDLRESGVAFDSYGFPDAQPLDGLTLAGQVRNHSAVFLGTRAIQLFCVEAASAGGMPVRGLSGGPCLYQGALIGIFRASLMRDNSGLNVGGTLYACPVAIVAEACRDLLDWPDPCAGLPGVDGKLPQEPFRYLSPYEAEDALIFSGRCREIGLLLRRLTAADGAPVLLLHGESGVGKSSLLHAGLLPRWDGEWKYARRDPERGLVGCLAHILGSSPAERWVELETSGEPLLVVLDQVEEAWTKPLAGCDELGDFLSLLGPLLTGPHRPRGRLVLSIRREWFKSVEERLNAWKDLRWEDVGIGRLERASIVEVVTALTSQGTLGDPYRLRVDPPGLPADIADDLLEDPLSPVAPVLQILLTRLWERAKAHPHDDGTRVLSRALYLEQKSEGYHLVDFFDRQMQTLRLDPGVGEAVESGLALDILAFHVTSLGTAASRTRDEVAQRYVGAKHLQEIMRRLQDLYVIASVTSYGGGTRLAHDTLAPHVLARFAASQAPGQRARRILENRIADWKARGTTLDAYDLGLTSAGLKGMRRTSPEEDRLVTTSTRVVRRRRTVALLLVLAAAISTLALGATFYANRQADRARLAESRLLDAQAALRQHDIASALRAFGAAIDNLPSSDARSSSAIAGIVANVASAPRIVSDLGQIRAAALSVDADKILVRRDSGRVEVFQGTSGRRLPAPDVGSLHNDFQWMNFLDEHPPRLSRDGTIAALVFPAEAFNPGTESHRPWAFNAVVWRPGVDGVVWEHAYPEEVFISHGPRGHVLITGRESAEVLRISAGPTDIDMLRLSGGTIVERFPPTGEPYLVWRTGEPGKIRFALVDIDKIPRAYSGTPPNEAIVWAHELGAYFGKVRWQGNGGKPAFIVTSGDDRWYCDSTSCRVVARPDYAILTFAEAPTMGARALTDEFATTIGVDISKAWNNLGIGSSWAQGPNAGTISFFGSEGLHVLDLYSGAEQVRRSLGASVVASAWSRSGKQLWAIYADGRVVSVPIRAFSWVAPPPERPGKFQGWVSTDFSRNGDRSVTVRSIYRSAQTQVTSAPTSHEHKSWEKTLPSDSVSIGAKFSTDGHYVLLTDSTVSDQSAQGTVTVLLAESGVEQEHFDTSGWLLQGDTWIGKDRRLGAVSKFVGTRAQQLFALCEWSAAGPSACRDGMETLARISRDGNYFLEDRVHATAVYSSNELKNTQPAVLEIAGVRARNRFDRALLELLVIGSESISVSVTASGSELIVRYRGGVFVCGKSTDGHLIVRVGARELRFPARTFEGKEGLWGPQMRVLSLTSDGRRMLVDVSGHGDGEVWDVVTGTVLAVLPVTAEHAAFSIDDETVELLTESQRMELLYLGPANGSRPSWVSEAAMSAWTQGTGTGEWRTAEDVSRAISAEGEDGDRVSKHVSQMLSEAWNP